MRTNDLRQLEMLDELKKRCPRGYFGQLYELVKPTHQRYELAIKVGLSQCLKYLVVDSPVTSKYCSDFLKEKGI